MPSIKQVIQLGAVCCGRLLCGCRIQNPTVPHVEGWQIERVHEIFTRKLWFRSFDSLNTTQLSLKPGRVLRLNAG